MPWLLYYPITWDNDSRQHQIVVGAGPDILNTRIGAPDHPFHSLVTLPTEVSQLHDP